METELFVMEPPFMVKVALFPTKIAPPLASPDVISILLPVIEPLFKVNVLFVLRYTQPP
ncbi:MAG: hypothetical protein IKP48_08165 [Bacteroidaceae bacterium]|nr:hypothetical protein [Bacteroidaceae bacterium]